MKALVVYKTELPDIDYLKEIFTDIKVANIDGNANGDFLPSKPLETSIQGVEFLSKIKNILDFDVIIFSNEILPKEIASYFASKNNLASISHVSGIEAKDDLSFIVYSWKNLGLKIASKTKPTVIIANLKPFNGDYPNGDKEIIEVKDESDIEFVRTKEINFTSEIKSKITIGVGLGVSKELLNSIFELADKISAKVVCTRPVADLGYLPYDRVVGDTGSTLHTDIYIALGISGAQQHLNSVKAEKIIAVNKDPSAPIFSKAQIKINEKVEDILPGVIEWAKSF
jgi:electron transfer flavoprotein alpha subunit